MTFTYTSAELADIAASIPTQAAEAGLLFLPGAKFEGEHYVALDGKQLSATEVVHFAARVGASFVSVSAVPFDLHGLVAELVGDDEDLPDAVKQVVTRAQPHDGSTEGVSITWVAEGLAYVWHAQTEWTDSFLSELYAAQSESDAGEDAEHQESLERERRYIADAAAALVHSPEYRAESKNKRGILAPRILADAGLGDVNPSLLTAYVFPLANRRIAEKVYEYEQDFVGRKKELALELNSYHEWLKETTKVRRKTAAIKFLTRKADGNRLSTDLAEEISDIAALIPLNTVRQQS
ncbi:hypothetical protein PV761_10095 [Arthrobacter sp. CC3]|uniref:hypothetical protein n=1 Tax=Arthrobacter sp. CC3 TaxID=3029185 RepID=UPI003267C281